MPFSFEKTFDVAVKTLSFGRASFSKTGEPSTPKTPARRPPAAVVVAHFHPRLGQRVLPEGRAPTRLPRPAEGSGRAPQARVCFPLAPCRHELLQRTPRGLSGGRAGYVACTTDRLLADKPDLWDLFIDDAGAQKEHGRGG